ncbi:MAG: hypothetical protein KJ002_13900 [Candidatus Dadabacteria bacterium]|nr:hypothetical protein [Candidatus Dadabacteria bacterium]
MSILLGTLSPGRAPSSIMRYPSPSGAISYAVSSSRGKPSCDAVCVMKRRPSLTSASSV